jgi:signal transduction histidine kinase
MWLQDEFLGAIILLSTKRVPFSPETLPRLEILSHYAATAIYSAENQARQLKTAEPFALVGTMLGGFLHTMRNELTGAKGFWDNLNNMSLPEPARERLDNLGKALRATSQICQDLVTFDPMARPTTEKIPLNDLLDETWLNLSRGGRIHGVTIKTLYAPTKPVILGNRVQIETAIRMLLQNSMEALAEVGPRKDERSIRLQTQVKAKCVILRIADSGPGMSEETRRQAFRPFFTTKPTGNGLGLAVVWHVAKRHKARIKLVTRAGWGTSVSLFFPREVLD